MRLRLVFLILALAVGAAACGRSGSGGALPLAPQAVQKGTSSAKIQHVVIVIQENRSFDNFFSTFPNADGTTTGKAEAVPKSDDCVYPLTQATTVPLTEVDLLGNGFPKSYGYRNPIDLNHIYHGFQTDWDKKQMDGFDREGLGANGSSGPACTYPYQYVNPNDIAPYWDMAKQYVLSDRTFQDQGSGSFTAHQELIAGGTDLDSSEALIDNPSWFPWGCDGNPSGPHREVTAIIKRGGKVYPLAGPFPCFTYTSMRDLLDAKSVSWKFYAEKVYKYEAKDPQRGNTAGIWSAFDAIKAVRYSSEWKTNVTQNNLVFFHDLAKNQLPAVSWITPDGVNSDHPGDGSDTGPSWVASIVNAVGQSSYWNSTAVIVLWDDWGGLYDHVPPPEPRTWEGGPGFRVPLLIVSPYVKPHVEHTVYEFGSILHFIEDNWNLGTLGKNDEHSTSLGNAFDFDMAPRKFKVIPSKYSLKFFLRQKPSGTPPDTQ
ncbi:MAG TPA: alkaline phosphatase family protein [Candidatus Cybelea sp.]|jgi:phospholipase C|nr:alkaline phosphatase family protein [Candidatus Cybelea sp.]